jgi:hypothetical protein
MIHCLLFACIYCTIIFFFLGLLWENPSFFSVLITVPLSYLLRKKKKKKKEVMSLVRIIRFRRVFFMH